MESKTFLNENDLKWEDQGGGVSRCILGYNDRIMMVKVKFGKGSAGSAHSHHHSQTTYVGEVKMTIITGDAVYIKPGIIHSALCLEEGILIDVFSPAREDFLDSKTG
jgi:quercetin dioxygenase-like cupin family protein